MSWGRLGVFTRGLWHLRRAPDFGVLRSARSPDRLARTAAELANDLRDDELVLYGPGDRKELTQVVQLWLLTPALRGFALLAELGPGAARRGTLAAAAYMTITTTVFICAVIGAPLSYIPHFSAAVLATLSRAHRGTVDTPSDFATGPLIVDAAFVLVRAHPAGFDSPYTAGGHS